MFITSERIAAVFMTVAALVVGSTVPAQESTGTRQDEIAALKQSLQEGQARLRQYEWIETTIISVKGDVKSRKQNRCYYGADGTVQKTPIGDVSAAQSTEPRGGRPGRRGGTAKERIVENKKEEMQDYMQRATDLIHRYVPPDAQQIETAKGAGRVAVTPQGAGQVRVAISQYLQPGDALAIDLDTTAKRLVGLSVNSYLDKPDDPVALAVQMGTLPDGASYAAQVTLEASAQKIQVVVQNSGHRRVGS